ncbi:MAG: alpha-L-fucosidase [Prevotella sp.]|nr:alpha-L-fucosidase [Prevotella sp.]
MKNLTLFLVSMLLSAMFLFAQPTSAQENNIHEQSDQYEWPQDQQVLKKLGQWQDMKFGVLLHWGLYAVPGIVESWSICDEPWIKRDTTRTYQQYLDWYWGLCREFRPTRFNPAQWAAACHDAGMKYMIFTTKHHDGFCMFDSHETDFTIARQAFKDDPRRDVLRHVFDAFREQQFVIGAYYSKPDWHSQYYWWDVYAKKGRNVNYPIDQHPWRWQQFCQFTHRQIDEILSRYGRVDILWLDGGWVCPENRQQDINMPAIAAMARSRQPGIIIVDRTIRGPYENYQTPERTIPERQLNYPWESCIPLTDDWGYTRNARYKSAAKVIATLAEVVAKGGNMVLGVGPTPEGLLSPEDISRLSEIGQWLRANGKAIYNTTITPHYHEGNIWFTQSKDGTRRYAICIPDEGQTLPEKLSWTENLPSKRIRLLSNGHQLKYGVQGNRVSVSLPQPLPVQPIALEIE